MNLNTTQYLTPLARQDNTPITGGNVLSVTAIDAWKCVFVHALSNEEEQGAHNVYIDLIDEGGRRLQQAEINHAVNRIVARKKNSFGDNQFSGSQSKGNCTKDKGGRNLIFNLFFGLKNV